MEKDEFAKCGRYIQFAAACNRPKVDSTPGESDVAKLLSYSSPPFRAQYSQGLKHLFNSNSTYVHSNAVCECLEYILSQCYRLLLCEFT